ncbi:hypothetical protein AAHE18_20G025100 [Arachis hypogaea]
MKGLYYGLPSEDDGGGGWGWLGPDGGIGPLLRTTNASDEALNMVEASPLLIPLFSCSTEVNKFCLLAETPSPSNSSKIMKQQREWIVAPNLAILLLRPNLRKLCLITVENMIQDIIYL